MYLLMMSTAALLVDIVTAILHVGKKSNYVIWLFETLGRNLVFHFRFEALAEVEPFLAWDDTFFDIHR